MAEHTALARIAHSATQRAERAERREARKQARGETVAEKILQSGEVLAGAALGGILQGLGHEKLGPVPLDLLAGLAGNVAALWGVGGKHAHDIGNVSDGFLAAFASDAGHAIGQRWKATGHLFGHGSPASPAGAPPAVHGELDPRMVAQNIIRGGAHR
jgi:hypothetical protein